MSFIDDIPRPLLGRSSLINASDSNPLESLNPAQKKAVRYIDGPLLVLVGAGCGKTSVVTHKIAWLIKQCGYRAGNVTAVTFTNKAAREMKERISNLLPHDDSRGLTVCTFHNLGLKSFNARPKLLDVNQVLPSLTTKTAKRYSRSYCSITAVQSPI